MVVHRLFVRLLREKVCVRDTHSPGLLSPDSIAMRQDYLSHSLQYCMSNHPVYT